MHITLVRHGETEWNRTGRAQGHQQIPLNETGRMQAQKLRDGLGTTQFDLVWCSDLVRAQETIQPWLEMSGTPVAYRKDLRERSFGDWEGQPYPRVLGDLAESAFKHGIHETEARPPNGESYQDVFARLNPLMGEIRDLDLRLMVVSHGGTLGCLMAQLFRATHQSASSFRFRNVAIAEVAQRKNGDFSLERYNDTRHLG